MHKFVILVVVLLAASAAAAAEMMTARIGLPNCQTSCGGVSVPYPFGIGDGCYHSVVGSFNLTCDRTHSPPKLLLGTFQVIDISLANATVRILADMINITREGHGTWGRGLGDSSGTFTISHEHNQMVVLGCNVQAALSRNSSSAEVFVCTTFCDTVLPSMMWPLGGLYYRCVGFGCCQKPIINGSPLYDVQLRWLDGREHTSSVKVFIAEKAWLEHARLRYQSLRGDDIHRSYLAPWQWTETSAPAVLQWAIQHPTTRTHGIPLELWICPWEAATALCRSSNSYCRPAVAEESYWNRETRDRYVCRCRDGYQGNPYLTDGCQDINECELPDKCYGSCSNIPGGYLCQCPHGTQGDPHKRNGCAKSSTGLSIALGVGSGAGLIFLVLGVTFLNRKIKARKKKRLRERFFTQNRGQLLLQMVSQRADIAERMIFSSEELEKATNNFDKARELGGEGHGTVFKGILSSLHVVAIKKSKIVIQREIDEFINEVAILSQINHRNIVKLFGCCLETEVPLLVYEFISNGTLYGHLHVNSPKSLSWVDRLRIAVETARALAYLHSFVSTPIIHRDIKSPNILLDDNLTVKLSDFGASRYIPIDQTGVDTIVQGTFGYLDPMYYSTGHLSEKSDVYSFGVILIELLTRRKPVSYRSPQGYGLAKHFVNLLSEGNLVHILDPQVVEEGDGEVEDIALLAAICVKQTGEDRPTMRQVEMTLESIQASKEHAVSSDVTEDDRFEATCAWVNHMPVEGADMERTEDASCQWHDGLEEPLLSASHALS